MIILLWVLACVAAATLWFFLYFALSPRIGSNPKGARLARIHASPAYREGKFQNPVPTDMNMPFHVMRKVMWEMLKGGDGREPKQVIPVVPFDKAAWERLPDTGFALAWFGHSSLLLKLDGITFLTDPVFSKRASTFSFAGPKRFRYTQHMSVDLLPKVDVVLLSHDHYDHLDHATIKQLRDKRFICPLGVGAHLERWGVPAAAITECDMWGTATVGPVMLTLAPTRHFSGRSLTNRFSTLWGSWALRGRTQNIYFGADSGYSPAFQQVGERLGPFDLALLECGAYNAHWANIHMFPEETAQAALDVRTRMLMPIHWGKFSLALHPWKEPVTRLTAKAKELGLPLLTPRIGRIITGTDAANSERWWEELN
ncbi:MAG TPA: MBL fold metallo-hydrolase [Flavobacteriales bacterium]|jgi:L-ascorbate metabolism protein UlaG (beta-lactamase superfamily)|nr:MBL fold metallo-hydrolase [Flavobacteriales bacterium]